MLPAEVSEDIQLAKRTVRAHAKAVSGLPPCRLQASMQIRTGNATYPNETTGATLPHIRATVQQNSNMQ